MGSGVILTGVISFSKKQVVFFCVHLTGVTDRTRIF